MANHKQALKRHRQSLKRRDRNNFYKATVRTLIKKARLAVGEGDRAAAEPVVREAVSCLDHVVTKGAIPKGRADRLKSRLMGQLAAL